MYTMFTMSPNSHSIETLTWLTALLNCCSAGIKLAPLKGPVNGHGKGSQGRNKRARESHPVQTSTAIILAEVLSPLAYHYPVSSPRRDQTDLPIWRNYGLKLYTMHPFASVI